MSRLLALDQASVTTGWSIWIDGKLEDWGHFTAKGELGERLHQIREFVATKVADHGIDQIAFEDIQFQQNVTNNVQTFKALAETFGVIYELATALEIPNQAILAGTWKSSLGIKGKNRPEQKKNAQAWVVNTFNIKCISKPLNIYIVIFFIFINSNNSRILWDCCTWEFCCINFFNR